MLGRSAVQVAVLTVLASVFALAHLASEPLEGDPAMYGTIAKTIVATGEWHHLTFNGEPYYNKPPLHFWLNALVFHVLPPATLTASLLPSLLLVAATLLLYALCRRTLAGGDTAFLAALVFLTTPEVIHWGRGVHLETLVTVWVLGGLWAVHRSTTDPRAVVWLGVAAVGGWLAKGPQGVFPLLVAPLVWWRAGVLGARVRSPWSVAAGVLVVAGVGAWTALRGGEQGFLETYFGGQIAHVLVVGGWFDRGPFWYVLKLLRTYWPWLPFAVVGLVMAWRQDRDASGPWLWVACTIVVMLVISAAEVKKSRYLFQVYPALAATAGLALAALGTRVSHVREVLAGGAALGALAVLAFGGGDPPRRHVRDAIEIARQLAPGSGTRVLLTDDARHGQPRVDKVLGFHAAPLLASCAGDCAAETAGIASGVRVVARVREAEDVAAATDGTVLHRTGTLVLIGR